MITAQRSTTKSSHRAFELHTAPCAVGSQRQTQASCTSKGGSPFGCDAFGLLATGLTSLLSTIGDAAPDFVGSLLTGTGPPSLSFVSNAPVVPACTPGFTTRVMASAAGHTNARILIRRERLLCIFSSFACAASENEDLRQQDAPRIKAKAGANLKPLCDTIAIQ